jgi:hypothetical protein
MRLPLALLLVASFCLHGAVAASNVEAIVSVDERGHLRFQGMTNSPLVVQGEDVLAALVTAYDELKALSSELGLAATPFVPTDEPATAACLCVGGSCAPAVRSATGALTCCASSSDSGQCRWAEPCNISQASSDRQVRNNNKVKGKGKEKGKNKEK